MSAAEITSRWMERASDWANPILIKEVRQALKSRHFLATFLLLLTSSWLASVFLVLSFQNEIEYGAVGTSFFYCYYVVLAVALFWVVPFGAYHSLLNERDRNTYELLSLSTLTPRQIVWGKLLGALVQCFIYYSAITPFIAFASLLQGFDAPSAAYILVMTMIISLVLSMVAIMMSTFGQSRQWRGFNSMVIMGGLSYILMLLLILVFDLIEDSAIGLNNSNFWWGTAIALIVLLSYFALFHQITTAQLTFESGNHSSGVRTICTGQFCLWLAGWWLAYWQWGVIRQEAASVYFVLTCLHCAVVGLYCTTEKDVLSRRVSRSLPHNRFLRLILVPFLPGGARGMIYLLLHLVAFCLNTLAMVALGMTSWNSILELALTLSCYIVIYLGLGATLGRGLQAVSSEIRPAHVRVLTILLIAAGIISPYIPALVSTTFWRGYSLWFLSNPFETAAAVADSSGYSNSILLVLGIGATLVTLINIGAMQRGLAEALTAGRHPRKQSAPSAPATEADPTTEADIVGSQA